jgi:cell division protein ZapA (FtsZ GTPase activity inhibitor)
MSETVRVNIYDQIYSLRSPSGDEHIRQIAQLVDERMRQISAHTTTFDLARIAVLAALNIADELQSLRTQLEQERQGATAAPPSDGSEKEERAATDEGETNTREADDGQSWFEAIFDAEVPVKNRNERLSSQISAKLQSRRQDESKPLTVIAEEDT